MCQWACLFSFVYYFAVIMASGDFGNSPSSSDMQDNDEDPVESMIKKTGCMDVHYKVQVEMLCVIQCPSAVWLLTATENNVSVTIEWVRVSAWICVAYNH